MFRRFWGIIVRSGVDGLRRFWVKFIPKTRRTPKISETRDKITLPIREKKTAKVIPFGEDSTFQSKSTASNSVAIDRCPYCSSKNIVRRGLRKKKYEVQQRFLCNVCCRSFVSQKVKGKSFPLKIIFEGLSFYNIGFSLDESCRRIKEQQGIEVRPSTLSDWLKEFAPLCRYSRLRPYGLKLYSPNQVIQTVHLFHRQVYDFSMHRAKLALLLQEHKHAKFENLREFLEAIQAECPHQFFKEGERGSELKVNFDLSEVILKGKQNFATRLAGLALQAVNDNKERHKALQRFMLCNDSVTVAVEVPLYMDKYDLEHLQDELGFKIPLELDKVLTGHIDILQIRNGSIHILDYKPNARKFKQADALRQLTLYALMLSRLTGLRVYDFKCAWFDQNDYFEFFPLHVVYKLKKRAEKDNPGQMKMESLTGKPSLHTGCAGIK